MAAISGLLMADGGNAAKYSLALTPKINADQTVSIDVDINASEVVGYKTFSLGGEEHRMPIIKTNRSKVTHVVKNGETLLLSK